MHLRLAALLAALAPLAACDFQPTLDIDLPEHQPATVINAVLVVDSVATVRLGVSTDPYVLGTYDPRRGRPIDGAVVTLLRDGQPVERLAVRPQTCEDYDYQNGQVATYECGPYAGTVPVEAGGTYTVRAEVPGLPTAEGTVTMPRRPSITVEEIGLTDERRQFRVRVQDPPGQGDRYGVALLSGPTRYTYPDCDDGNPPTCRDITDVQPRQSSYFSSSDPVLLAAARDLDLGDSSYLFLSVTDASFDGSTWTFAVTADYYYYDYGDEQEQDNNVLTVQIAGLSGDVYDAYQISTFGGQDIENPFIEPVNLPTNVTGGYGLVGGVALAEVTFEQEATRRVGRLARR